MPKLKFLSEQFRGRVLDLTANLHDCGRGANRDFVIEHETISSLHCTFLKEGDCYVLVDHNSTNGTKVNGVRIKKQAIAHGDYVQLGQIELIFQDEENKIKSETRNKSGIQVSPTATQTLQLTFPAEAVLNSKKKDPAKMIMIILSVVVLILISALIYFLINLTKGI